MNTIYLTGYSKHEDESIINLNQLKRSGFQDLSKYSSWVSGIKDKDIDTSVLPSLTPAD